MTAHFPELSQRSAIPWLPEQVRRRAEGWRGWVGPLISLAVLVAALVQMRSLDLHRMWTLVPTAPAFWLALAGAYMALPLTEWLIYRKLWALPLSGIVPLLRKRISNELLLGYSGEVYFYAWARRRAALVAAPFGVIKDVAILSAQVGNIVTLVMLAVAWPLLGALHLGIHARELVLSCGFVVAMALPAWLFRRQILTLPAADLWLVAGLHLVRVIAGLAFTAAMWHAALPHVALSWWVMLAAMRQLLSRLPLMPNKDIAFAGLAFYLVGPQSTLVAMIAMSATVILAAHILLGAALAIGDLLLAGTERRQTTADVWQEQTAAL